MIAATRPLSGTNKRLHPSFWLDHDWYSLLRLRQGIEHLLHREGLLQPGQQVVDMGCGDCPYEPLFRAAATTYITCDLAGDVDVRIEPGQPLALPTGSVDGVVSFQVLEHVWNLDWYLGECFRILRPGGWLLLSTHGNWLYHPHPTDFRRWTRDGLIGELQARGFTVQSVRPVVGPLAWTTQFRLLGIRHVLQQLSWLGRFLQVGVNGLMNLRMAVEDAITPASIHDSNASVYVTLSRKPVSEFRGQRSEIRGQTNPGL